MSLTTHKSSSLALPGMSLISQKSLVTTRTLMNTQKLSVSQRPPKLADYCVASADSSSYWAFKVQDHPRVLGEETRKILLFWIKALESKYQENFINDLCKPKLSKPDSHIYPLLPFCCENASPKVKVSWSRGKVKSGSTLSISKRIPLDTWTTKVVPKKSMVVYQLRWSDWRDSRGKVFMLAC